MREQKPEPLATNGPKKGARSPVTNSSFFPNVNSTITPSTSTSCKNSSQNYSNSLKDLAEIVFQYPKSEVPVDIYNLFIVKKSQDQNDLEFINAFMRARDTIYFSKEICAQARIKLDFRGAFDSGQATINLAEQVVEKLEKHPEKLKRVVSIVLTDKHLTFIPNILKKLEGLRCLSLGKNKIKTIPRSLRLPILSELFLEGNLVRKAPSSAQFPKLTRSFLE